MLLRRFARKFATVKKPLIMKIVESEIDSNRVIVFRYLVLNLYHSKSYCPYCIDAKNILKKLNVNFKAIELDQTPDGGDMQAYLLQKTGQRTVPNIFISKEHIGGCDDLMTEFKSGSLHKKLGLINS